MITLAQEGVITLGKGDILGLIFLAPVLIVGIGLAASLILDLMINGFGGSGWMVIPPALGVCALTGWGLWEFAHWLTG